LLTAVLARWKERQSGKNQYKAKSLFHIKLFYLYNEIFPAFGIQRCKNNSISDQIHPSGISCIKQIHPTYVFRSLYIATLHSAYVDVELPLDIHPSEGMSKAIQAHDSWYYKIFIIMSGHPHHMKNIQHSPKQPYKPNVGTLCIASAIMPHGHVTLYS
jgi:hypothetical protein